MLPQIVITNQTAPQGLILFICAHSSFDMKRLVHDSDCESNKYGHGYGQINIFFKELNAQSSELSKKNKLKNI